VAALKDINGREWLVLGVFAAACCCFGVYPKPLTDLMDRRSRSWRPAGREQAVRTPMTP
jgi:NADH:ubiquinone oxidoreductase subunit 4 (subunit M)